MSETQVSVIEPGVQFRSVIADCNALWEVKRRRGRGVWECEVVNEPFEYGGQRYDSDHAGMVDVFDETRITAILKMEAFWSEKLCEHEDFWNGVTPGSTLHYRNGRNQFVRGVADRDEEGNPGLRPTALVGAWRAYELPSRNADGSIHEPYQVQRIREGAVFQPNVSNIVESPSYRPKDGEQDPRELSPLDLTVPEPTDAERALHARVRLLNEIKQAIEFRDIEGSLARVKALAERI